MTDEIWEGVQANHAKLNSCTLHDFSIDMNPDKTWGKRYQCTNCGGHVDAVTKGWYEKGLEHAKAR